MRIAARKALRDGVFGRGTYFGDTPGDKRASAELAYEFVAIGGKIDHPARFDDLRNQEAILSTIGVSLAHAANARYG